VARVPHRQCDAAVAAAAVAAIVADAAAVAVAVCDAGCSAISRNNRQVQCPAMRSRNRDAFAEDAPAAPKTVAASSLIVPVVKRA